MSLFLMQRFCRLRIGCLLGRIPHGNERYKGKQPKGKPEVDKVLRHQPQLCFKKVGVATRDDIKAIARLRRFRAAGFLELQSIVGKYGITELSLRKMAAITLGINVSKAQRLSNWEASSYTPAQCLYAATDAWVCLQIYKRLIQCNSM